MSRTKIETVPLNWLLRVPVLLIWVDTEQKILRWQISSMAEAMLLLKIPEGGEQQSC